MDFQIIKNKIIESQSEDTFVNYIYWKNNNNKINTKDFAKFVLNKINSWDDYKKLNADENDFCKLFDELCIYNDISVIKFEGNSKYIYFPFNVTRLLMSFIEYI